MVASKLSVTFLLAHMRIGGAEVAVANWLGALPRDRINASLIVLRRDGPLLESLPAHVTVRDLGGRRSALAGGALRAAVKDLGTDVLYTATSAMNIMALAALHRSGPVILASEHSSPMQYLGEAKLSGVRRFLTRRYYPKAAAILTPTDDIRDELSALLAPRRVPVHTLPNPILSDAPFARDRDPGLILTAGRLVKAKGLDVLIRAMNEPRLRGTRLRVFGDGSEREALEDEIAAHGLTDRVEFRGNTNQLIAEIAKADCFVLPSRREGFGNVIVEALYAGVPVVASDLPGPRKLLNGGAYGKLVPPDNHTALANAISDTLGTDPSEEAIASVAPYSIARSTQILLGHIEEAARRH